MRSASIIHLRLVAAAAEKLAYDIENGKLWPGEATDAMAQIQKALQDASREMDR